MTNPPFAPGQFWRTRGGLKSEIYSIGNKDEFPIHCGTWHEDGAKFCGSRTSNGFLCRDGTLNKYDLISIWIDKPIVQWDKIPYWHPYAWINEDGSRFSAQTLPIKYNFSFDSVIKLELPSELFQFTGDWKDSLVERPK